MYIFDIDGTLSDVGHRLPYILNFSGKKTHAPHWNDFLAAAKDDPPIPGICLTFLALKRAGETIIISTGRREDQREMTEKWLAKYALDHAGLFMRPLGDYRSDTIVKPEVIRKHFGRHIPDQVTCIFEDRARVTKAWRDLGYTVCQVAEGDY
jgi:hypothetical protein